MFSIVICTLNRADQLQNLLSQLEAQAREFSPREIIVIDNNSTDRTKEVVQSFVAREPHVFKYFFESRIGISYARNLGWRAAKGEIVAFIDDDVTLSEHWLANILKTFDEYKCDAVGGRILPIYPESFPSWVKTYSYILRGPIPIHDCGPDIKVYTAGMDPFLGANMAFRKSTIRTENIFNENVGAGTGTMGEDTEVFMDLAKGGRKIVYCGPALVWHPVIPNRMTLRYIAGWNVRSGRFEVVRNRGRVEEGLVCYGGVPRYLLKEFFMASIALFMSLGNRAKFLPAWIKLFKKWGHIEGYYSCEIERRKGLKGVTV